MAFAPDYGRGRRVFGVYVDTSYEAHVVEVFQSGSGLQVGDTLLDVGTTPGGCRPGGGIDVDSDGMLYVAVGDMGTSGDAQDDGTGSRVHPGGAQYLLWDNRVNEPAL